MKNRWFWCLFDLFLTLALVAVPPLTAQDGPAPAYWAAQRRASVNDLVSAFNRISSHAGQLRAAMPKSDAEAFDAVMMDMMGALVSLPAIGLKDKPTPGAIRPTEVRPDRVGQLLPEAEGLVRFFERLRKSDASRQELFAGAEKSARRMAAALPNALPTVSGISYQAGTSVK
jgi:hypothetical protein